VNFNERMCVEQNVRGVNGNDWNKKKQKIIKNGLGAPRSKLSCSQSPFRTIIELIFSCDASSEDGLSDFFYVVLLFLFGKYSLLALTAYNLTTVPLRPKDTVLFFSVL